MKYLVKIVAISVVMAGLVVATVHLFNRLCEFYSKLLFQGDTEEYYSWPV